MIEDDPRRARPSASIMGRLFGCAGSWRLAQQLKASGAPLDDEEPGEPPDHLVLGNVVHEFMRSGTARQSSNLTDEQRWMVSQLEKHFDDATSQLDFYGNIIKEQRLWSKCGRFSGQADISVINLDADAAAVFDYKTGRVIVEPAATNAQVRTLAVLLYQNFSVETAYAGIIQPRSSKPLTMVKYTLEDLEQAEAELDDLMVRVAAPDSPLTPGEWCNHCPVRSRCPALGHEITDVVVANSTVLDPRDAVDLLSVPELGALLTIAKRGIALFEAAEARARALLNADPNAIPGWKVTDPTPVQGIEDAQKAFELLAGSLSAEQFASVCKVTLGRLEKVYHEATGGLNKKASKEALRKILAPVLVTKLKAGSAQRIDHDQTAPMAIEDGS